MKLIDWAPSEFAAGTWDDTKAWEFKDVSVVSSHGYGTDNKPWPGTHKNVMNWCILENGYAVGWNENPSVGWSFPVKRLKL